MSGLLLDNPLPLILKAQLLLASELLSFLSCVSLLALWFGHCSGSPQRGHLGLQWAILQPEREGGGDQSFTSPRLKNRNIVVQHVT